MNVKLFAVGVAAAIALSGAAYAGDAANGEKLAKTRCATCHTFEQGGAKKVGPNLFGVTTRGPGKSEGFNYSASYKAAAEKGFAWDAANLDEYITDPTAFLAKKTGDAKARSNMTFKLAKPEERADVIAYLATLK